MELIFDSLIAQVAQAAPPGVPLYLVGGAVRDALLGQASYDLDFVIPEGALAYARRLGNALGAAYFPLDEARDTARLVLVQADGRRVKLDIASWRGPDLESDLRGRDFTINALAVEIHAPQTVLDPLHGATDLRQKVLRLCAPTAFSDDPLRTLRAVRQAEAFGLRILPETLDRLRQAAPGLAQVSPERLRDELFRMLDGPRPAMSVRLMERLGLLEYVLPELQTLKGVSQSAPHVLDVWEHTLSVVERLEAVLEALRPEYQEEKAANLPLGLVSVQLGRYRAQLAEHLAQPLNVERSRRAMLMLAALYHDVAKPQARTVEDSGRVRFLGHDEQGSEIAGRRAQALRLSNPESDQLKTLVHHHMRPLLLSNLGTEPSRRSIYRFFRATEAVGVDICWLSLADFLGTYGPTLPQEAWAHHLEVIRALLAAWWEHPAEVVAPPPLLKGHDLIDKFGLTPGPLIGKLLEVVREAQATGQIQTRKQALALVKAQLKSL
jgi:tRNA nucleotidyltransferase/poly(A) polymerase